MSKFEKTNKFENSKNLGYIYSRKNTYYKNILFKILTEKNWA